MKKFLCKKGGKRLLRRNSKLMSLIIFTAAFLIFMTMQAGFALAAAQAPVISPNGGTYTSAQSVKISNIAKGDTAYYTTDGTDPRSSKTAVVYRRAFTISQSETIKAAVCDSDDGWSAVTTATFVITNKSINDLEQKFGNAVNNNQLKQAKQFLMQIKQNTKQNKINNQQNDLKSQLLDAITNKDWNKAKSILDQITKLGHPAWANSLSEQINKKCGNNKSKTNIFYNVNKDNSKGQYGTVNNQYSNENRQNGNKYGQFYQQQYNNKIAK